MTHRLIAASALALVASAGYSAEPPARLRLVTGPTARGLAPEASQPPALWADQPLPNGVRPLTAAEAASLVPQPPASRGLFDFSLPRTNLIGHTLTAFAPSPTPTYSSEPTPVPALAQIDAKVYASKPAYRWYGWGAMTPGRNPMAPEGRAPKPSEAWLNETGATPGAFPSTANPAPVEAVAEQPRPTPTPATPTPPAETVPASATIPMTAAPTGVFNPNEPVSMTNVPPLPPGAVLIDPNAAGFPPPMVGIPMTPMVPFSPPVPTLTPMPEAPQAWHSAGGAPKVLAARPTTPTIIQASATAPDFRPPIERMIATAAQGTATVTEVRFVGPNKLIVSLRCLNAAAASAATKAISALPAVKPREVEFAVILTAE